MYQVKQMCYTCTHPTLYHYTILNKIKDYLLFKPQSVIQIATVLLHMAQCLAKISLASLHFFKLKEHHQTITFCVMSLLVDKKVWALLPQ
jgi:hypothetical protein